MSHKTAQGVLEDLKAAERLNDYEAVEVLWVAFVKAANTMAGRNEHERMLAFVNTFPISRINECLSAPAIDILLDLDPPLETVLADPNERLDTAKAAASLNELRAQRTCDPQAALIALGEILKRIRNKRAHGFKNT
jgi:hypothetical protein